MSAPQDAPETSSPGAWRRFLGRLPGRRRLEAPATPQALRIYGFALADDLLRGWQTHVVRQREIHEESARRIQRLHYVLGVLAALSASLAGSSAVAAWQRQAASVGLASASVVIAAMAAVLTGVVTFLDFGGRAERHRKASVDYKRALRRFELHAPFGVTRLAVALTSAHAARLFGLYPRKGTIAAGADADLALWDPGERRVINGAAMASRAGYSVYDGWAVTGWPRFVIRRGQPVLADGQRTARPGQGQWVRRDPVGR